MTPDQITALAREFSKEHDDSTIAYQAAKDVIRFLLRRFCLVEKETVRKEYEDSYRQYLAAGNARPLRQQYFFGRCFALEYLFPEIAKEVEEWKSPNFPYSPTTPSLNVGLLVTATDASRLPDTTKTSIHTPNSDAPSIVKS